MHTKQIINVYFQLTVLDSLIRFQENVLRTVILMIHKKLDILVIEIHICVCLFVLIVLITSVIILQSNANYHVQILFRSKTLKIIEDV